MRRHRRFLLQLLITLVLGLTGLIGLEASSGAKALVWQSLAMTSTKETLNVLWIDQEAELLDLVPSVVRVGNLRAIFISSDQLNERVYESCNFHVWASINDFIQFHSSDNGSEILRVHSKIVNFIILHADEWMADMVSLKTMVNTLVFAIQVHDNTLTVYEAYSPTLIPTESVRIGKVCSSPVDEPLCNPMTGIWERRKDLTGVKVKAVGESVLPFAVMDPSNQPEKMVGIFPELLMEVMKHLNFSLEVTRSPDGSWGRRDQDGSFSGMMGMLQRREVDVTAVQMFLSQDRAKDMDPSMTIIEDGLRLFVKTSDTFKLHSYDLMFIFYRGVWICLLTLLFFMILAKALTFAVESKESMLKGLCRNFFDAFAVATRMMLLKGYTRTSSMLAGKVLLISLAGLALIFFAHLRAGLLSILAVKKQAFQVRDLEEALNSDYQLGTIKSGAVQATFEQAPDESLFRRVWNEKMKPNFDQVMVAKVSQGYDLILDRPKYIYVVWNAMATSSAMHPCHFTGVGSLFNMKSAVFALQKHSPLLELFNYSLLRLKENGLMEKIVKKWISSGSSKDCHWMDDSRLGLEPMFSIFLILLLGIGSSCGLFLGEVIFKMLLSKKIDKQRSNTESFDCDQK